MIAHIASHFALYSSRDKGFKNCCCKLGNFFHSQDCNCVSGLQISALCRCGREVSTAFMGHLAILKFIKLIFIIVHTKMRFDREYVECSLAW